MATIARENILNRIKEALTNSVPLPFPNSEGNNSVFVENKEDLLVLFAQEFKALQGKFSFCKNEEDFKQKLQQLIKENGWTKIFFKQNRFERQLHELAIEAYQHLPSCEVSITDCESLVARTGTMVLGTAQASGRTTSVYAPIHICVAHESQVVYDVKDALVSLTDKYGDAFPSFVTFASGPSRTADIEKTLVTGVHGPKEVYCFLVGSDY